MEGKSLNVGGVAVLRGVRHPISVAKAMLKDEAILIAGEGARAFARKAGLELCSPEALKTPDQAEKSKRPERATLSVASRLTIRGCWSPAPRPVVWTASRPSG